MAMVLESYIEITEGVRGGKPRLSGTRITVSDIVIWHLRMGQSLEEIAATYELSFSAVYAAIAYYYDHREEIDGEIERSRTFYEEMKRTAPSLLKEKLRAVDRD